MDATAFKWCLKNTYPLKDLMLWKGKRNLKNEDVRSTLIELMDQLRSENGPPKKLENKHNQPTGISLVSSNVSQTLVKLFHETRKSV